MFAFAVAVAASWFRRVLFCRVMVITIRRARFFNPCRQKLQINQIGSLNGSTHQVHLLEGQTEANANVSRLLKMIDILLNSFTCDAVPGLSPALRNRT